MRTPPHRHVRRAHSKPPVSVSSVRAPVSIQARRVWALPYARQLALCGLALAVLALVVSAGALLLGPEAAAGSKLASAAAAAAAAPRSFQVPAGGATPQLRAAAAAAAAAPAAPQQQPARAPAAAAAAPPLALPAVQAPPPPAPPAGARRPGKRRVYFVMSAGHSGESFLAELLKVSTEIAVDREAFPSLLDFAGVMHLGREATFKPRHEAKVPSLEARLAATAPLHYADVNHMFAKSQVDVVMDYFSSRQAEYEVHLITLRRWLPQTLQYWLLEDVWDPASMAQYVGGEYTLFHKPFARLPPLQPAYAAEDSVNLILGYLVDMELQAAAIRAAYPWAVFHQLRYEDLLARNGTARTLAALDLAVTNHLDLLRFEGSTVDDPLSWKDATLRDTPIAYFEAATELFLRGYGAKGLALPPLPHMARMAPCESLGASAAEALAGDAAAAGGGSDGSEGGALGASVVLAAGPYVAGSAGWAGALGGAPVTPARFLPPGAVGAKTSRRGSALLGEGLASLTCGVPPAPMSEEAARAVRGTVQLARNRVGPGATSAEERALPAFLAKEKARWELVVKDFLRKQQEYEKFKNTK